MSRFDKNYSSATVVDCISALRTTLVEQKAVLDGDMAKMVCGMESLNSEDFSELSETSSMANQWLIDAGMETLLHDEYGTNSDDPEVIAESERAIALGMEAATIQLLASGDLNMAAGDTYEQPAEGAVVMLKDDTIDVGYGMESYMDQKLGDFAPVAIVMAGLTASANAFDEMWYPSHVVAAGSKGVNVSVQIPYVHNRGQRSTNGTAFNIDKTPLLGALEDHTILASDILTIYPNGGNVDNDGVLVDPTVVPNRDVEVDGVTVSTRPIVFGANVDLMSVSYHAGLLGAEGQDATDTISENINLGKLYIAATTTVASTVTGSPDVVTKRVIEINVSGNPGAIFTRPSEGTDQELVINYDTPLNLSIDFPTINATQTVNDLGIGTLINAGTNNWTVAINPRLSGKANIELANILVDAISIDLGTAAIADGNGKMIEVAADSAEYTALKNALTLELVGYEPLANRTNAGLRQIGTLIDKGTPRNFFFEIRQGSPMATIYPHGPFTGNSVNVDYLKKAIRIKRSNTVVTELLDMEAKIKYAHGTNTIVGGSATIGGSYVTPTYLYDSIDAASNVIFDQSSNYLENLKAVLIDTISVMSDRLALESGYQSALREFGAGEREYELIIGCDPRLEPLLMRSGDERTFGTASGFKVESSLDLRFRNQIRFSFRRTTRRTVVDPMSWGVHFTKPPVVHELSASRRTSSIANEIHVRPYDHHVSVLPIMGRLDITNIDVFYKHTSTIINGGVV